MPLSPSVRQPQALSVEPAVVPALEAFLDLHDVVLADAEEEGVEEVV